MPLLHVYFRMITYVIFQTIIITYIFYVKVIVLLCDAVSVNAVCNFLYQEYKIPSNKTTISTKKLILYWHKDNYQFITVIT